ncbi:MAG: site-2 protease family protein [Candidatus Helarchaeota archaeon]|nr:site-2 protease family protein [Candidatus Helarchaeota archaeon]
MLIFWACLYILNKLFNLKKRGWEIEPGILLIKTRKFNRIIDKIARKAPNLWRKIWNVGIVAGIIGMVLIIGFLTYNFIILLSPSAAEINAILPLIPGVTVGGETLLQIIIPLIIIMVSHELAHGIAARIDKIKLKSSGFLMFLVLFGAFVEVDEKKLQKKSANSQMRVFSAGSFANMMVGFFTFTIFINANIFLSPFYSPTSSGVLIQDVSIGPTMGYLSPGSVIRAINGTPILDTNWLTLYMWNTKPNQTLKIITDSPIETLLFEIFPIKTWVNTFIWMPLPYEYFPLDSIGALGVSVSNHYPADGLLGFLVSWLGPIFYYSIIRTISWVFILSLGVALFNLLPIPMFDGDKLWVTLVNKFTKTQKETNNNSNDSNSKNNSKKNGQTKRKYTKADIIINIVRIYSIFLFLGSVAITVFNMIIGTFNLSSFLG